jgi:hypothetical protein
MLMAFSGVLTSHLHTKLSVTMPSQCTTHCQHSYNTWEFRLSFVGKFTYLKLYI